MATTCSRELSITILEPIPDPFFYYKLESNPGGTTIVDSVAARDMSLSSGLAPSSVIPAKIGNGFQFSAQAPISIHRRDNADCAIQGLDVTMRFWVFFNTADVFSVAVQIIQGSSWFILNASNDGGFDPKARLQIRRNVSGADNQIDVVLPMNQWNHILCWHEDGVEVGLRVNNGTPSTLAFTDGIQQTNSLRLNANTNSGGTFIIDEISVWKGQVLTTEQQDADWNGGNGVTYPF